MTRLIIGQLFFLFLVIKSQVRFFKKYMYSILANFLCIFNALFQQIR